MRSQKKKCSPKVTCILGIKWAGKAHLPAPEAQVLSGGTSTQTSWNLFLVTCWTTRGQAVKSSPRKERSGNRRRTPSQDRATSPAPRRQQLRTGLQGQHVEHAPPRCPLCARSLALARRGPRSPPPDPRSTPSGLQPASWARALRSRTPQPDPRHPGTGPPGPPHSPRTACCAPLRAVSTTAWKGGTAWARPRRAPAPGPAPE